MGIRYTDSAGKHGISEADAFHVIANAVIVEDVADRRAHQAKRFVGPRHAQTTRAVEVIAHFDGEDFVIFHAQETGQRL